MRKGLGYWIAATVAAVGVLVVLVALVATIIAPQPAPVFAPVPKHPCSASNFYQQCVGPEIPSLISPPVKGAPRAQLTFPPLPTVSGGGFGVDFAWGGPSGAIAKAYGARFGASYLSGTSKDWSYSLTRSYIGAGLGVVLVWESAATRSTAGWNAGYNDAWRATHEAVALGFRAGHIDFASDYDTTGYNGFVGYYQGAVTWDHRAGFSTGAYGGLHTVATLCADHLTTRNWQTIAWSYNQWVSAGCAPLRQTSINLYWHGYSTDYDYAVAADYGQANYTAPVPPKPRTVCFGRHAQRSAACRKIQTQVQGWQHAAAASQRAYSARGCPKLARSRNDLQRRWAWFHAQLRHHPRVKTASRRRALARTSKGLASVRRTITGRGCPTFASRAAHNLALAHAMEKRYS